MLQRDDERKYSLWNIAADKGKFANQIVPVQLSDHLLF